jgi:hypothetical protein
MLQEVIFPQDSEFLANLILQRKKSFITLGGQESLDEWVATGNKQVLVDYLESNDLVEEYQSSVVDEVRAEAIALREYLGDELLDRIVSVGTGNGLLELFLVSEGLTSEILLIDIEEGGQGFNENPCGCANLEATKSFILDNVPDATISTLNPTEAVLPDFEFTLFLSTLSMGFEYPCNDYVNFIRKNATIDAVVVLDKINDTTDVGLTYLFGNFAESHRIDGENSRRLFLMNIYRSLS